MVWKALDTLVAHRSWKVLVQRLHKTLETKLASAMGGVESGGSIQANTSSCVPVTPVCSPSSSRVPLQGRGSCSHFVLLAGRSQMSVCLSVCRTAQSVSGAQQYLTWLLLFLWGRGGVCSIQSASRSVGGIACVCRKGIVAVKLQQKRCVYSPALGEVGNSRGLY